MKTFTLVLSALMLLIITNALYAVVYPFPEHPSAYIGDEPAMKIGTKLCLFYSESGDVKKTININDVLVVYRGNPSDFSPEIKSAGKVKVLSALGKYYYEAEVIDGSVLPGYLARKGNVACFITSFKKSEHK